MTEKKVKDLPLGTSDFAVLRMSDQIYFDKTRMIFDLASRRGKYLLARPRRFGKSLLITTFESLFKYGLRDFKGLAIEKLWKEGTTCDVVRLDFSEVKDFDSAEEFRERLGFLLYRRFAPLGFVYEHGSAMPAADQLSFWFSSLKDNSLVLLIDEYDAPLTTCLNQKELFDQVRKILSNFYAVLKSNDRLFRFLFLTGITKFNKASIFSELNNLSDLTLSP